MQETADAIYQRTEREAVSLAVVVREFRVAWGDQGVKSVHHMTREVGTCMLHREDIEVGDVVGGKFAAWHLDPWDADEKISTALMTMDVFFEDERQLVFRRKQTPNFEGSVSPERETGPRLNKP